MSEPIAPPRRLTAHARNLRRLPGEEYPAAVLALAKSTSSDLVAAASHIRAGGNPQSDALLAGIEGLLALDRNCYSIPDMRLIRWLAEAIGQLGPEHAAEVADVLLAINVMLRRACRLEPVP
jgi:hypothetical protein